MLSWNRYAAVAVSRKHAFNSPAISNEEIYCFQESQNIRSIAISMWTRHHFHLLTEINQFIQYTNEDGLVLKWERDSSSPGPDDNSGVITYNGITWRHFGGGMIAVTLGLFISAIVFAFELFVKHMTRKHRRSTFWKVIERLIDGHRYELL